VLNPAHWNQYLASLCLILAAVGHAAFLPVPTSVSDVLHPFAVVQFLVHTVTKEAFFLMFASIYPPINSVTLKIS
jgi:hypothetical protein